MFVFKFIEKGATTNDDGAAAHVSNGDDDATTHEYFFKNVKKIKMKIVNFKIALKFTIHFTR